ncbi:cytidine deaminase [Candidatus Saccharibacteria bacterium]|jgi:Cytidine deaminase|nr:cytidine deaminase [Candidatus Saccharibacteria bacterium]
MISNRELIDKAAECLNPWQVNGRWMGDVAAALVTDKGDIYVGVCVDPGATLGICAERAAIMQMIADKQYTVKKIVAVWNNNPAKDLYVLPPCGVCREFMKQVCKDGLDIEVVLGEDETMLLRDLLPKHEWPERKITYGG